MVQLHPIVKLPFNGIKSARTSFYPRESLFWKRLMESTDVSIGHRPQIRQRRHNQSQTTRLKPPLPSRTLPLNMLRIVHYPHPTLQYESKQIVRVDVQLKKLIENMFDLMYEFRGVGLAANQVDLPLRLFVVNESGQKGAGEELVFINPVLSQPKGTEEAEEGCLSLPGVYAPVRRPKQINIQAYNLQGQEIKGQIGGFLARVVQHEFDHINGVMFIDRIDEDAREEVDDKVHDFEQRFKAERREGLIGDDDAIALGRAEMEKRYC
jgi:peptide deformylase